MTVFKSTSGEGVPPTDEDLGISSGRLIRVAFQLEYDVDCEGWIDCRKEARLHSSGFRLASTNGNL